MSATPPEEPPRVIAASPSWRRGSPRCSTPRASPAVVGHPRRAGSVGYSEHELLEKCARDSKILDIFEGTQQIQQLIVARRTLGFTSAELK